MVDLLAAKLTGEGGPRAVDPRTLFSAWRRAVDSPDDDLPTERALEVARTLGAGQVLLGSVVGTARHIELQASLVCHGRKLLHGINCNILSVSRGGALLIPDGKTDLRLGDLLYAAGSPEALRQFAELLKKESREVRRVTINGGGNITYYLAQLLEAQDIAPKILEPDAARCKFLAERLKLSVVLQGTGTDPEMLREENIDNTDVFIALTRDEEDNILSSLLAKRAGASRVIALLNKPSYAQLAAAIGIDAAVSPNRAAVSAILHFIRKGKVVSVTTVGEEAAEALEIVVLETSELAGKPLREADIRDALVGAIVRGDEVIIPRGDDVIEVGDHVVIFALRSAIPRLERQMMVQLQYF